MKQNNGLFYRGSNNRNNHAEEVKQFSKTLKKSENLAGTEY